MSGKKVCRETERERKVRMIILYIYIDDNGCCFVLFLSFFVILTLSSLTHTMHT